MTATPRTAESATPERVNLFTTFIDVIASPGKAFRRISEVQRRSWILPAVLCLLAPLLYYALTLNLQVAAAARIVEIQRSLLPPDSAQAATPVLDRMTQPGFLLLSAGARTVLGLAVSWAIATTLIYFSASLAGADLAIARLWPVVPWTWLPFAIRDLTQLVWTLANGKLIRYPGLSYFFATGDLMADQRNLAMAATSHLDLFTLWHACLIYVIFRALARLSAFSAFLLTLLYAAISIGFRLLPLVLSRSLSPTG